MPRKSSPLNLASIRTTSLAKRPSKIRITPLNRSTVRPLAALLEEPTFRPIGHTRQVLGLKAFR